MFLDLHVWLKPEMRLDDAHTVSHVVKDLLMERYPQIADAVIHIEPPPVGWKPEWPEGRGVRHPRVGLQGLEWTLSGFAPVVSSSSSLLLQHADPLRSPSRVDRFDHVVDGQRGGGDGGQRFHLDAGLCAGA